MAPSIWQILIVVLVVVLLFGAGRLPRIMEDLAKGMQAFKKGMKDEDDKKQVEQKTTAHKSDSKTE